MKVKSIKGIRVISNPDEAAFSDKFKRKRTKLNSKQSHEQWKHISNRVVKHPLSVCFQIEVKIELKF
jgi:hypothetical protein